MIVAIILAATNVLTIVYFSLIRHNDERSSTLTSTESGATGSEESREANNPYRGSGSADYASTDCLILNSSRSEGLRVAAASVRGPSHAASDTPRQDSFSISHHPRWLVAAIADGSSSGTHSHVAANWAAETAAMRLCKELSNDDKIGDSFFLTNANQINRDLLRMIRRRIRETEDGREPNDRDAQEYFTTLEILLVSSQIESNEAVPYIWSRFAGDGRLLKYSNEGLIDGWNDEDSCVPLHLPTPHNLNSTDIKRGLLYPGETLLFCTDGITDVGKIDKQRVDDLLRKISTTSDMKGPTLTTELLYRLHSASDDRTLVAVWRPA